MINQTKFKKYLDMYKKDFTQQHWDAEKYKWEAVKRFQDIWDINAPDFKKMFSQATDKTRNLLASNMFFPKGMIEEFSEKDPEFVRTMFINLFDETKDFVTRINQFKSDSVNMLTKCNNPSWRMHYQKENAILTYLWLKYPNKYYIYKFSEFKGLCSRLEVGYKPKQGDYTNNLRKFMEVNDELCALLKSDQEINDILKSFITSDCFPDIENKILTGDFEFYINNYIKSKQLTKDDWKKYIEEVEIPNHPSPMKMLKGIIELGGEASCKKLSETYGGTPQSYIGCAVSLGRRVHKYYNLDTPMEDGYERYSRIPFEGSKDEKDPNCIYKICPNLLAALKEIDLTNIDPKYLDFLFDVYVPFEELESLKNLIKNKKNVILQGAPGVGKTFTAKRLAYSIMDEKADDRIEFIQFHQNYSYEDFIMGYKPEGNSFKLQDGIFYLFCEKARNNPKQEYFFIIDEINRGNMSKIFGELLLLIEKDYRGVEAKLAYNGKPFSVPQNLYIIGMMNTADRSLAMIDYALRRRFSFFEIRPGFSSVGFKKYQDTLNNDTFDELIKLIEQLNKEIIEDESLGEGFCIGHSYFCGQTTCTNEWMREVIEYDIIPMLKEYWFDNKEKVTKWQNNLLGIFND